MLENQQLVDQPGRLKTNTTTARTLQQPVVVIESTSTWTLFDWRECLESRNLLYFLVLRDVTVLYKQTGFGQTKYGDRLRSALAGRRGLGQQTLGIILSGYTSMDDAQAAVTARLPELTKIDALRE